MDYIRLSFDVIWRFINLDYAFSHASNHTSRPLYVYSDVGSSNVLGDQITDFIRAIDFRREGKGSSFYEPTHLHFIYHYARRYWTFYKYKLPRQQESWSILDKASAQSHCISKMKNDFYLTLPSNSSSFPIFQTTAAIISRSDCQHHYD